MFPIRQTERRRSGTAADAGEVSWFGLGSGLPGTWRIVGLTFSGSSRHKWGLSDLLVPHLAGRLKSARLFCVETPAGPAGRGSDVFWSRDLRERSRLASARGTTWPPTNGYADVFATGAPWISCKLHTRMGSRRRDTIASAAALAPLMVVMHGTR